MHASSLGLHNHCQWQLIPPTCCVNYFGFSSYIDMESHVFWTIDLFIFHGMKWFSDSFIIHMHFFFSVDLWSRTRFPLYFNIKIIYIYIYIYADLSSNIWILKNDLKKNCEYTIIYNVIRWKIFVWINDWCFKNSMLKMFINNMWREATTFADMLQLNYLFSRWHIHSSLIYLPSFSQARNFCD